MLVFRLQITSFMDLQYYVVYIYSSDILLYLSVASIIAILLTTFHVHIVFWLI